MSDRIFVRDLLVRCILGLTDEERRERQDVLVSLVIYTDLRAAAASDRVADSVNYRLLKKQILGEAERSNYHLLEALAEHIAEICLSDSRVRRVRVTAEKPGALRFARSVGVTMTRTRKP
jgi:D-erythro-7,8-dihydroneopterin triphosphate epimerase